MLSYIWFFLISIGYIVAIFTDSLTTATAELMKATTTAVELCLGLIGTICFWNGLMQIAADSGLINVLSKLTSPVVNLLFKNIPKNHPAKAAISLNIVADMLGIGNAATPFGIRAVKELNKLNPTPGTVSNDIITFLILNTCVIQLVPSTIIALRVSLGSTNPTQIVPIIWITSMITCIAGIIITKTVLFFTDRR